MSFHPTATENTTSTKDTRTQQIGHILFLFGLIIAVVAGVGFEHPWLPIGLALFGIFVGLVDIKVADTNRYLITGKDPEFF